MDEVTVFRQRHIDSSARQVSEIPIGEATKSRSLGGATFTKQVCSSFKNIPNKVNQRCAAAKFQKKVIFIVPISPISGKNAS